MIVPTPARASFLPLLLVAVTSLAYGFQSPEESTLVAEMNDAIEHVKRIVNDPVPSLPRTPDARVSVFSPGWFHEGAAKPNFLSLDVRATQEFPYDKFEYVTSDLNPGVMFRGRDLEFNGMTKYFYTDRSMPKKRLEPAEMAEINRLYRIIGAREQELVRRHAPPASIAPASSATASIARTVGAAVESNGTAFYVSAGVLLAILAIALYRLRGSRP
jgi:hypothetical protein